ncbi:MAG: replicative DNA helicase [Oscillospiraceae bacterium]|nr:replicative DNA helicase [Oscillospiraceae bacterium]
MDELFLRQMPHSPEAEQAVLGSMLIDSRCVPDVVGMLRAGDFYSKTNADIFRTIYSMFTRSVVIDPVTVLEQMKVEGVFNADTSADYVLELMNITPTAANVKEYAEIVRGKALLRSIAEAGDEISGMALASEGEPDDILEAAEKKVYDLRAGRMTGGLEPISQTLVGVFDQLAAAAESDGTIPGVTTGLVDVDNYILGLNRSDLIILASRPGMGKTSFALNVALAAAQSSKKTVAIFSLEMSREQLCLRLLSSLAQVNNKKLQTGRLSEKDWDMIAKAAAVLGGVDIRINDNSSVTVADVNAQCRRVRDLGLIVVDYLQLMQSAGGRKGAYTNENRQTIVSEISRMLKITARELDVPVICLSQLSRDNEKRTGNKRPMLSDLRESGAIEQDADIVMGLYRDDYYNKETDKPNVAECIVLKNRRGETGTVELRWEPEFMTFSSYSGRDDE